MDPLQDPDSDGEDDPSKLLDHWLGELNTLGKGLDLGARSNGLVGNMLAPRPVLRPQDPEGGARQRKQEYRCSVINLDNQDEELDAILGELTMLQGEFETEIKEDKRKSVEQKEGSGDSALSPASDRSSSNMTDLGIHSATHSRSSSGSDEIKQAQLKAAENGHRTDSPDTDSAFCDNLSVLSSCSTASSNKTGQSINVPSSLPALTKEEQEARVKAEKIKIAIEKIKEASVKKLFIKVFTCDGSAKSLLVDEKMTVAQVTRILAEKNHVTLDPKWALVELVPDLYMERVYEDNELVVENCLLWKVDSKNTLWFIERPEKFDLFLRPEVYLLGSCSSQKDDQMEEHSRQELLEEYFSSSGVGAPQIEGFIWLKADSKKSWKKFYFVLRSSGLYYAPKGKKTSKDLVCLTTFDMNQVYYGINWQGKYKAPSEYCFGIKHPQIQAKNPKYIKYLCVDTQKELHEWVTGIRIAKNGQHLCDNYKGIVDDITHTDIDMLTSQRFSTRSSISLKSLNMDSTMDREEETQGQTFTPLSENKSLASALSSGIESDMSQSSCYKYGSDDGARIEVEALVEKGIKVVTPVETLDRGFNLGRSFSRSSRSSTTTSGSICEEFGGFESDFHAQGTIKKRPTAQLPLTNTTYGLVREPNTLERDTVTCEELLPPPPHTSDSLTSLDSLDLLPPPPPLISCSKSPFSSFFKPALVLTSLPPVSPKPSTLKKHNSLLKTSCRKISFDDNVQMIEAVESPIPKYIPAAPIRNSNPKKLTWGEEAGDTSSLPRAFLDNLQKVMNKKWQVAEKCQTNMEMTPHKVLGFRTEEPVSKVGQPNLYSKDSAIGAWVLETQMYQHESPHYSQESPPQAQRQQQLHHVQHQQLQQQNQQLSQQQQLQQMQHQQAQQLNHQQLQHHQHLQQQQQHPHQQQQMHQQLVQQQHFHQQQLQQHKILQQQHHQHQLSQHMQQQQQEYQQQQYGHNGVYGEYQMQAAQQYGQVQQVQEMEQPLYSPGQPVVLREPEPSLYADPGMMRQNKTKRPPPPPRRSQETQLSNHVI